jgi:hypothetical protein
LNNSKNAGCILRSPASHCCHTRQVVYSNSAAAVWVSPATSRAALIAVGAGLLAALPARLRLGWLGIRQFNQFLFCGGFEVLRNSIVVKIFIGEIVCDVVYAVRNNFLQKLSSCARQIFVNDRGVCHFVSPASVPEARCLRCADNSQYTRNARNVNMFLNLFLTIFTRPILTSNV